ncbi:MAG: peptidoglycan DD-metalloendopeptidase family protein [Zoogloeaceae bacterium]|jgi:septal ring factor EnvC (AmiA/AmiB activator)|nr:peptidoglycan DD-metalloendopeptidase family protein [Zoogloeaceae bacterium]
MRLLVFLLLLSWSACALPQSTGEITSRKEDLKELRSRIEALKKEISANEESRVDAADQLKQVEEQISDGERQLRTLQQDHTRLQDTLQTLARASRELEITLSQQQKQLEKLLYRQYLQASPDALQLALNGNDPNQLARDLYYLLAIARARAELLADMRATLTRQKKLTADARAKEAELAEVRTQQEAEHAKLLGQKRERQKIVNQIAGKIKAQKQEIGNLQKNEKNLSRLIDRLTRVLAEQERRRAEQARKAEAARKKAEQAQAKKNAQTRPGGKNTASTPDAASNPENRTLPSATSGNFATLKGRLRLPVRGQVTGRFGAAREGGGVWKGLFILAPQGSEVKAIAKGQVVYAEWMRGFGNLLIIDHGAGYLTVYGNNDALYKQVGDQVEGGETVCIAGNSGGNSNSGLYFELRHQGQALDPMKWVSLK